MKNNENRKTMNRECKPTPVPPILMDETELLKELVQNGEQIWIDYRSILDETVTNSKGETIKLGSSFEVAKRDVELAWNGYGEISLGNALQNLGFAIAHSVVRKLYNVSGDYLMLQLSWQLVAAQKALENRDSDNFVVGYDLQTAVDLSQAAIVGLYDALEEAEKVGTPIDTSIPGWLEFTYSERKLHDNVRIREKDSAAWRWETVNPIQRMFRAARGQVKASASVKGSKNFSKFDFVAERVEDDETKAFDTLYTERNLWEQANGRKEYVTEETQIDMMAAVRSLKLTKTQRKTLIKLDEGFGYKAIATYMGRDADNVQKTIKGIRVKGSVHALFNSAGSTICKSKKFSVEQIALAYAPYWAMLESNMKFNPKTGKWKYIEDTTWKVVGMSKM